MKLKIGDYVKIKKEYCNKKYEHTQVWVVKDLIDDGEKLEIITPVTIDDGVVFPLTEIVRPHQLDKINKKDLNNCLQTE